MIDDWTRVTDDEASLPKVGRLILWYFDGQYRVTSRAATDNVTTDWLTPTGDSKAICWQYIEGP